MSEFSLPYLKVMFGEDFVNHLGTLNVLIIGVGGIGCELLKALSPYKFNKVEILDLDKIEVSNLNRQFLFRNHHVGKSKAHVAKETVGTMFPHMNVESYHDNIFEPKYAINFFKRFQIVFMALDNQEARSYVNRICMILDLPLLEAGTTGHKGQAMLIKKGMSRCYSCFPKPKAKTYPVCTIRTTPEKPIHCIIWGKHFFDLLFGPQEKENPLIDLIDSLAFTGNEDAKLAATVFNDIFYEQIVKTKNLEPEKFAYLRPIKVEDSDLDNLPEISTKRISNQVEDIQSYVQIFLSTFKTLKHLKEKEGPVVFDKDHNLALKFVSAISNIRAHVFNIPLQSEFIIKEMAGNIVPTIASTNAIVAAIQVTEAIKYLQSKFLAEKSLPNSHIKNKELYVQNTETTKVLEASLGQENPQCLACNENFLPHVVFTNFENTLKDFVEHLKQQNPELKEFRITNSKGGVIYETFEDVDEDEEEKERNDKNLSKTFSHWFGTHQDEIILNDDTTGSVDKYLFSNDAQLPLNTFNFVKKEKNANKPSQLHESMITKMMDDKSKEITANQVKAHAKTRDDAMVIEEEEKAQNGNTKPAANDGMILLEDDDEDEIIFEPVAKKAEENGTQGILGKRAADLEEVQEEEVGPLKKVKS